ncbi:MAG: homocysteine biosynthesis protein [Candidatus Margulisbacteria bacterium]|nr:homocysteine biosynthesis protein [Candidatus Margulisiibacteriota bacterium]
MIVTNHQLLNMVNKDGLKKTAAKVDKVSLGVFEPLDHIYLRFAVKDLDVKPFSAKLQNVPLHIENNDHFLVGSQTLAQDDPMNSHFPGEFTYGGAFLIEDLINKKHLDLRVNGYINDVFEKHEIRKNITMKDISEAELIADIYPYQGFKAYVNSSEHFKFTENGMVKNNFSTINFRSSGILQLIIELRKNIDKIFFGGTNAEYIFSNNGHLKITGNFLKMDTLYISGLSLKGFGVYLAVGIGALINVNKKQDIIEKIVDNENRCFNVFDIAAKKELEKTTFKDLKKPIFTYKKNKMKTASLTSLYLSEKIAEKIQK